MTSHARSVLSLTIALSLIECGTVLPDKVAYIGQSAALQSGCQVSFEDSWAREGVLEVRLYFRNLGPSVMYVDRDGFLLELGDGRVLHRQGTVHDVYSIPPGGGHQVSVSFTDPGHDIRSSRGVLLSVGGISYSTDLRQRVVGHIQLVRNGSHP
jgi:hypothetical protein